MYLLKAARAKFLRTLSRSTQEAVTGFFKNNYLIFDTDISA